MTRFAPCTTALSFCATLIEVARWGKGKDSGEIAVSLLLYPHEDREAIDDIVQPRLARVTHVRSVAVEHLVAEDDRAEANPENDGASLVSEMATLSHDQIEKVNHSSMIILPTGRVHCRRCNRACMR